MRLNPISFKGIYDIRFPKGTKPEVIDEKLEVADKFIKEHCTSKDGSSFIDVRKLDWFDYTKSDRPVEKAGLRLSMAVDNPAILCALFDKIDEKLGQQYINKAKVELILDTQA